MVQFKPNYKSPVLFCHLLLSKLVYNYMHIKCPEYSSPRRFLCFVRSKSITVSVLPSLNSKLN